MADAMTPRDALAALADLPRIEEKLTARTGGLTSMLWGLVGAAIFLTYATASDLIEANGAYWAYGFLWMPWVAAGIAFSGCLWASHAVSLRRDPETRRGLGYSLGLTLGFLVLAGALFFGFFVLGGVTWDTYALMTVANGLFAFGLGVHQLRRRHPGGRWVVAAGLVMAVAGFAFRSLGLGEDLTPLLGAGITGAAWFAAGLATFLEG